ncbi:MAG: ribonuclease R [Clostridiaceae bacterium]|nr:ribonuclease R [Clostridiaceae bacterium]
MEERKNRVLSFMRERSYTPLKFEELAVVLDVPSEDRASLQKLLDEMEAEGLIIKTRKERYGVPERMGLVVGQFQGNPKGFGFVLPDFSDEDLFIPANAINGAMHGDRVVARISRHASGARHQEGEIINIIKRVNKTIVGKFDKSEHFGFVTPDHARLSGDIFIPKDFINGAQKGQKVVVEITKWPEKNRNAEGRIIEILGYEDEKGVDVMSIIRAYNIPYEFPDEVIKEAQAIPTTISEEEIAKRRDLRSLRMVTIDGEDARDLDDAVSIEILPDGNFRLGVHIADVTHYVKEGSHLDREALKRGTSVYFPDRVIPMLPKELSNNICSLNAHEDRLAFSVLMDIDSSGNVIDHDIFESVIHINERMTYTNVYKILEEDDAELKERYKEYVADFENMKILALILGERRRRRGSVDFNFDETKIIVDENGKTIDIKRYKMTIANKIIEEFMLLCNEVVSEHFYWIGIPFVYRIHEDPDPEKMENLNLILGSFGYRLKGYRDVHPKAIQDVLNQIKGKSEEKAISMTILRSLQKARYSDTHDWHFGLAAEYYSHFTSPIRRYPDLIIHRIMKEQINGRLDENRIEHYKSILHNIAQHSSERERAAQDAERDCDDLKKAEFMMDKIGQYFEGTISNITAFGLFVELENTVEGLVRLSSMDDNYYTYNERSLCLIGERTRKIYRIGDKVNVQLIKVSVETRQIDFIIVDENEVNGSNNELKEPEGIKYKSSKYNERLLKHIGAVNKKKRK